MIKKINIRKLSYHLRHDYLTFNNVALAIALIVGANWAFGSIEMMQRNYGLQKSLDLKVRQQELTELEVATLEFEQKYYESDEYKDLAAREYLGLASPGEKVLILPPNTVEAKESNKEPDRSEAGSEPSGNLEQWTNFLFGGNRRNLQK